MKRVGNFRIVRWYWKAVYLLVSLIILYVVALPTDPSRAGDGPRGILRSAAILILTIIAARVFRARDEDVAPPRAWWRMTGGWLAGILIAVVWIIIAAGSIGVALGQAGTLAAAGTVQGGAALGVVGVVLALLYADSSIRLLLERRRVARELDGPATQD